MEGAGGGKKRRPAAARGGDSGGGLSPTHACPRHGGGDSGGRRSPASALPPNAYAPASPRQEGSGSARDDGQPDPGRMKDLRRGEKGWGGRREMMTQPSHLQDLPSSSSEGKVGVWCLRVRRKG